MHGIVIQADNNVSVVTTAPQELPADALYLRTAEELDGSSLSVADLTATWNRSSDRPPIKRFKNRAEAVRTLWTRFEEMAAACEPETSPVPGETLQPATSGSKQDLVLDLLRRAEGATAEQMMVGTGWQKHSVRGFISGTVRKKLALTVTTEKTEVDLVYRVQG